MSTQQQENLSDWQDGQPTEPGLYKRQYSVADMIIFSARTDDQYFHYFDGMHWYLFGYDKKDAMREYDRGSVEDSVKYANVPWRGVLVTA